MKVVRCPACDARNTSGGQCVMCQAPLGSIPAAIVAAFVSATALALAWSAAVLVTHIQLLWFPALVGAIVSGAVAHASFGRGWLYQLIASTATIYGIVTGAALLVVGHSGPAHVLVPGEAAQALDMASSSTYTIAFATVGIFGGFWLWRQEQPSE